MSTPSASSTRRAQWRNPVMFVVYVGRVLTTVAVAAGAQRPGRGVDGVHPSPIGVWLWFTVLFANFAEALAEGRSKAQAASLRGLKHEMTARSGSMKRRARRAAGTNVPATDCASAMSCWSRPATRYPPTAR
jgi:K+-transporting ATPase ATPase B chain